jgi:hypothetical protein
MALHLVANLPRIDILNRVLILVERAIRNNEVLDVGQTARAILKIAGPGSWTSEKLIREIVRLASPRGVAMEFDKLAAIAR